MPNPCEMWKCGEGNTNSPELSLLKDLPLSYHHSHFLATTLDFTSFSQWPFGAAPFSLQLGCFGLDTFTSLSSFFYYNHA